MPKEGHYYVFILYLLPLIELSHLITLPSLPLEHYKFWFSNNEQTHKSITKLCTEENYNRIQFEPPQSDTTPKDICNEIKKMDSSCWGYEQNNTKCDDKKLYVIPECPDDSIGWARNKVEQLRVFFEQSDFGYIRERSNEIKYFCKPKTKTNESITSSLECSRYFRFCRASNILIDFDKLSSIEEPMRYRDDVIGPKQIGGWNCHLDSDGIKLENGHRSPLQSWFAELENYHVLQMDSQQLCDLWINKPTFIMKLDATVNMYHHFCDFINLYASLHLNNSFTNDNHILIWDTYPYRSNFALSWDAFTRNPILNLGGFKGKKICIRNAIFPLLPRMIYGIYYNMPLIPGCYKTGLFRAFNRHLLHNLQIDHRMPLNSNDIRITLISRKTKYRQILNEDELMTALRNKSKYYLVNKYDFNHMMSFKKQIEITANSDILIGMHGAGLTHCLFQPDWGVLFELYNCEDSECYKDLARLRGVKYLTWENAEKVYPQDKGHHPELGAHAKFTNYRFDADEFVRIVEIGVKHIRSERNKCNESLRRDEL